MPDQPSAGPASLGHSGCHFSFKIFDRRGIKVDDDSRERIESCTDSDALEAWLDQSFAVTKASDLFV